MTNNLRKVYIETYGCQMNVADSEVVASVLKDHGYFLTEEMNEANLILINTCSIRENAETRVRGRLDVFKQIKKNKDDLLVGVIGCMAERLKEQLLEQEKMVDLVIGPDAYRELPLLIATAEGGQKAINVLLSREETYADINPVRLGKNNVSAFISIMRGCNNMCSYCVVPYTRGRERSRDPESIVGEIGEVYNAGYREVTLIGQNVDSYHYKKHETDINFANLLEQVAKNFTDLRIRFSTSHPKDITEELLYTMKKYDNICKSIHLPFQSGSTRILKLMKRGYTREDYINRIRSIRKIIPGCAISTDIIAGFCTETDEDHQETLSLMKWVEFDFAYMFKYSERPDTYAQKRLKDDIPEEVKGRRLQEIIDLQNELSEISKRKDINKVHQVLIEGISKKSEEHYFGRNSQNKVIVFPKGNKRTGEFTQVKVLSHTSATLIGEEV